MLKIIKLTLKHKKEFKEIRMRALSEEILAFGDSPSEFYFKPTKYQIWYGAFLDKKLVGIASIKYPITKKFAHIAKFSGIYVVPEERGKGVAHALFESRICAAFNDKNILKIRLITNKTQKPAIGLYKQFGFKRIANLIKEFKINGKYYDAYLMELMRK